jgi:uncharacterized protein (DUF58 family)
MTLLQDETIAKLKKFQLATRSIVEGFLVGLHKSPYHGFSVEFSDHRQYNPGESLKDVDWKLAARTERYYVKRYEEETNLRSYIILDHSKSMFYDSGKGSKIEYATQLAAALAWLMLSQKDAVGLISFNDQVTGQFAPRAYRAYLARLMAALTELKPEGGTGALLRLEAIAESIRKRSLIIIISDFLEAPEAVLSSLKHFRNRKNEVLVFHITDEQEEAFKFKHETEFLDSETGEKIRVNPWQIRKEYLDNYNQHVSFLKTGCHQAGIEYNPVNTSTPFNDLLLKYLISRQRAG